MHFVLIDGGLLSVPPYIHSEDDVVKLIGRLTKWGAAVNGDSPVRVSSLSDVQETLALAGAWPIEKDISTMLEMYGLGEVFSTNDVLTAYFSLLNASLSWDNYGIEVEAYSDLTLIPDVLDGQSPDLLAEHTRRVFASAAFCSQLVPDPACCVASGLPHDGPVSIWVQSTITAVKGVGIGPLELPVPISKEVWTLDTLEDLATAPGALALWNSAQSEADIFLAISIAAVSAAAQMGSAATLAEIPTFSVGPEFVQSLHLHQAGPGQSRGGLVLETCARLVLGVPKHKPKVMGRKVALVRARDGAVAWRTHVYKGHEALRLMYWQGQGTLELANVENKFPVQIAEGAAGAEYAYGW